MLASTVGYTVAGTGAINAYLAGILGGPIDSAGLLLNLAPFRGNHKGCYGLAAATARRRANKSSTRRRLAPDRMEPDYYWTPKSGPRFGWVFDCLAAVPE